MKGYLAPLIFFLVGLAVTIIGSLFKLMHWPGANAILITGTLLEVLAIVFLIYLLLKKSNGNN